MLQLKFKNKGKFADEDSSRYEAVVNDNIVVRIVKDGYFEKGFVFEFLTSNGYAMPNLTGDYLSSFWSRATKRQAIERVVEIINDAEELTRINKHAVVINERMLAHTENK